MKKVQLSSCISVGGQPTEEDLASLAREGIQTVVNLRHSDEVSRDLSVEAERGSAEAIGLAYHHIPVTTLDLRSDQVESLRRVIEQALGPVYVHCGAGQRACSLTLLAMDFALSADALFARATRNGFPVTDSKLSDFIRKLDDHNT